MLNQSKVLSGLRRHDLRVLKMIHCCVVHVHEVRLKLLSYCCKTVAKYFECVSVYCCGVMHDSDSEAEELTVARTYLDNLLVVGQMWNLMGNLSNLEVHVHNTSTGDF